MPPPSQQKHGHGDPNFSWNAYDAYRPAYPPSLWSTIFNYHTTHHPSYTSALDLGCGSGAVSATLAHHFTRLTLADPSEHNMVAARARFTSAEFLSSLASPCEFSYVLSLAEEAVVEEASQDMVTMFEAIHWTDADAVMAQAARALKPGGTLALAYYTPRPRILGNARAQVAWDELWRARTRAICAIGASDPDGKNLRTMRNGCTGLDFVWLDPGLWEPGARRITVNCGEEGNLAFRLAADDSIPLAESRVDGGREVLEVVEREGEWDRVVDSKWFWEYTLTLQAANPLPDDFDNDIEGLWTELKDAVDELHTMGGLPLHGQLLSC